MPSSLIIVALVVAWLVVLVPMIVRKRQEIARTADSALAARVVRSAEEEPMRTTDQAADPVDEATEPELEPAEPAYPEPAQAGYDEEYGPEPLPPPPEPRAYRPGRGGFDPEAAAVIARARYAFRQRVVLAMLVGVVVSAVLAAVVFPMVWWAHGLIDLTLVTYLGYLRRQVRIEQEIRERRLARMRGAARIRAHQQRAAEVTTPATNPASGPAAASSGSATVELTPPPPAPAQPSPRPTYPGATVLEVDDEDPAFDELDHPDNLPYRRAAGE